MPKKLPFQAETDVEHDEASIYSGELMFRQSQILDHASALKIFAGGSTDDDYEHPALPLTSPRGMWNPSAIFPTFRDSFLRTREKNGFPTKQMSSCRTCEVDRFNPGSLSKAIGKSYACVCVCAMVKSYGINSFWSSLLSWESLYIMGIPVNPLPRG